MLLGLHPLLSGALLIHLDQLGHGDRVCIVDANFPAHRVGQVVVELPGVAAPEVVRAVRSVLPLDGGKSVQLMAAPTGVADQVHAELVEACATNATNVGELDRFEFYTAASGAGLVIRTGERRPYGNVVLTKGVVGDAS